MICKPTYVILNLSEIWLCESPRDKLRCDPNNILRPVEMCPDARARLFTACLCYNFKGNTIKNIIIASAKCTSLHSLRSLVFKPSPPHRVHLSELFFVQGWMAFSLRWSASFWCEATSVILWESPDSTPLRAKQHFAASWNVSWCQGACVTNPKQIP